MRRTTLMFSVLMLLACQKPVEPPIEPAPSPTPPTTSGLLSNTFKGYVFDYVTGAPVEGATVFIWHFPYNAQYFSPAPVTNYPITGHFYPSAYKHSAPTHLGPMYTVTTNSAGYYEHTWTPTDSNMTKYKTGVYKAGYVHPFRISGLKSVSGNNTDTLYLDVNTYVKFVLNNVAPAATTDSISVGEAYKAPDGSSGLYSKRGVSSPFSPSMELDYFNGLVTNASFTDTISAKSFNSGYIRIGRTSGGITTYTNQNFTFTPRTMNIVNVDY